MKRANATGTFSESLSAPDKLALAQQLAAQVTDDFVAGKISEIVLVSSKFVSVMVQRPEVRTLVPIVAEKSNEKSDGPRGAVEFMPSPEAVLTRLLPKYLEVHDLLRDARDRRPRSTPRSSSR